MGDDEERTPGDLWSEDDGEIVGCGLAWEGVLEVDDLEGWSTIPDLAGEECVSKVLDIDGDGKTCLGADGGGEGGGSSDDAGVGLEGRWEGVFALAGAVEAGEGDGVLLGKGLE